MKKLDLKAMVTCAALIAAAIVLSRFLSINAWNLKIGFIFVPVFIAAYLYGPIGGAVVGGIADFIGAILFPIGAYFPGFTVSACLTGIIYGLFLHKRKVTVGTSLAAVIAVVLGINLLVNTFWLTIILGKGYMAMLPARFVKELLCVPIDTALILVLSKATRRIYRPAA